jgi:7-cyano-7-deazaguanine synthase
MQPRTAVVLLSGGLDSTTALWKIKDIYSPVGLTERLSKLAGASHHIIRLPWLGDLAKTSGSAIVSARSPPAIRDEDLDDLEKSRETARAVWVPARNLIFLSIATAFAESIGGEVDVVSGFDLEEAKTFKDNSNEFVRRMNRVLELAVFEGKIKVVAPLIHMNKEEIARLAGDLLVPIEFTGSCYAPIGIDKLGRPIHCGVCESCMRRKRGLKKLKIECTIYKE